MNVFRRQTRGWGISALYLLFGACLVAGYYLVQRPFGMAAWIPHVVFDLVASFSAVVAVLVGVRRYHPVRRAPWLWIAFSQFVYFSADAVFFTYHDVLHDFHYPAPSEALYLGRFPFLAVGLFMLARGRLRERAPLIDTFIVGSAAGLLIWVFLMSPYADGSMSLAVRLTSLAFPVMDLMIVVALLHVFLNGVRTASTSLIAISVGSILFSDFVYGWMQIHGSYTTDNFLNATWMAGYLFLGSAALHPAMRSAGVSREPVATDLTRGKLILLAAASLVAPGVLIEDRIRGGSSVFPAAAASIVLFLLVVARLFDAAERQGRLIDSLEQAEADKAHLLARAVEAAARERGRLAIDLHDGPIQQLTALAFTLDLLVTRIERGDVEAARGSAAKVREQIAAEINSLRRLMSELRPPLIDERGLVAALEDCSAQVLGDGPSRIVNSNIAGVRFAAELETALYRIAREALVNIRKHAGAQAVDIVLERHDDGLRLLVRDDGKGFALVQGSPEGQTGLVEIRELSQSVGGACRILSTPGEGTTIEIDVPWKDRSSLPVAVAA